MVPARRPWLVVALVAVAADLLTGCGAATAQRRAEERRPPGYAERFEDCARRRRQACEGLSPPPEPAGQRAVGDERFASGVAAALSSDVTLSSAVMAAGLTVCVAGNHEVVWWRVGAGALHLLDGAAYGFGLSGELGFRIPAAPRWSVVAGARFLNVSDAYGDEARVPAHHILGQLGVDLVLVERSDLLLRLTASGLVGAERRLVARYDAAREVVLRRQTIEYGGALGLSLWLR